MADEQNKSNKHNAPNTLGGSHYEELERIGRRSEMRSVEDIEQRRRLEKANEAVEGLSAVIDSNPIAASSPVLNKAIVEARRTINSVGPKVRTRQDIRTERRVEESQNAIERAFSRHSINGQAAEGMSGSVVQMRAAGMVSMNPLQLEKERAGAMGSLAELEQSSMNLAANRFDKHGATNAATEAELRANFRKRDLYVRKLATIGAAERQQRGLGLDPESQMADLYSAGQRASNTLGESNMATRLKSGDLAKETDSSLKQKEIELSRQLVEALEKFKNSTTEAAGGALEAAQAKKKELEETQEARKVLGGTGGGGRGNSLAWAGAIGQGFGVAGSAIQQIQVNQRIGAVQNIAGYAGIENQKYEMYKAANQGDVASQLALAQWSNAEKFGKNIAGWSTAATAATAAGGIAQGAAGAMRLGSGMSPVQGIVNTSSSVNAGIQGGLDILQGGATTAVAGMDIARGISAGQSRQASMQAYMAAVKQVQAIPAEQLQGFRDYGIGMAGVAARMGGQGGKFLNESLTDSALNDLQKARISPQQMAQMSEFGVQNIGSQFSTSQITSSQNLFKAGYGTMQENMQRMSTLAGAGSNNPQAGLASVLEASFSKSLEGSKVLNMMVENTAVLSQSGAGRALGIDTTGAAAQVLASGVNASDPNKEQAVQRAMTAAQRMQEIGTSTGINFADMAATARVQKMTGLSGTESIIAQQFTQADLLAMKKMDPSKVNKAFEEKGINVKQGDEQQLVAQLTKANLMKNLTLGGASLATGVDIEGIADKVINNRALTKEETLSYNRANSLGGTRGAGSESLGAAGAAYGPEANQATKEKTKKALEGDGASDMQNKAFQMMTQGAVQQAAAAAEATKAFGSAAKAMEALYTLSSNIEKTIPGSEGKFKTAGADAAAAGAFGTSVVHFDKVISKFDGALDGLIAKAGLPSSSSEISSPKPDRKGGRSPGEY